MLEKQRHQLIIDILNEKRFASVPDLSSQLNASEATIRRDITKMDAANQINKIWGGAEALSGSENMPRASRLKGSAFLVDKEKHAGSKRMIAKKAVELCIDGEPIIINGGSSTYMMSEFLMDRQLNILTNSIVLAQELWQNSDNQISLPGGEIYRKQGIIMSSYENDSIQNYQCSKMFMGTPGIGEFGVMESDPLLIRAEQKLRKQADKLIVMADSSKLGRRSNLIFAALSEVDILITDKAADPEIIRQFQGHGVEVVLADDEG
ncbi:MAG: DeoR/GlpR transcriptional regulator [Kordiimonadaceae bacterium]|nr:DeoR/GlpR transcriptional regulator [Kordiimonadaceae bacterium]